MTDSEMARINAICKVAHIDNIGDLSDGFHTFNDLYYQRCMLFASIVKQNRRKAWKSHKHRTENFALVVGGSSLVLTHQKEVTRSIMRINIGTCLIAMNCRQESIGTVIRKKMLQGFSVCREYTYGKKDQPKQRILKISRKLLFIRLKKQNRTILSTYLKSCLYCFGQMDLQQDKCMRWM